VNRDTANALCCYKVYTKGRNAHAGMGSVGAPSTLASIRPSCLTTWTSSRPPCASRKQLSQWHIHQLEPREYTVPACVQTEMQSVRFGVARLTPQILVRDERKRMHVFKSDLSGTNINLSRQSIRYQLACKRRCGRCTLTA
jgi:response regulator of citrate/malate metabolism